MLQNSLKIEQPSSIEEKFYAGVDILNECFPSIKFLSKSYLDMNNDFVQSLLSVESGSNHELFLVPRYSLLAESPYDIVMKLMALLHSRIELEHSHLGLIKTGYIPSRELDEKGLQNSVSSLYGDYADFILLRTDGIINVNRKNKGVKLDLYTALMLFLLSEGQLLTKKENKVDYGCRSLCLVCEGTVVNFDKNPVIYVGCGGDLQIGVTDIRTIYSGVIDISTIIL